jgi:hypothetical protein
MNWTTLLTALFALLVTAGSLLLWAGWQWRQGTEALRSEILGARLPLMPTQFNAAELEGLPAPVQRYFRRVLKPGQPMVAVARFTHSGSFNMGESAPRWRSFTSDQIVTTRRPGFDWDARITLGPGLEVRAHDAYVAGEGLLIVELAGLVSVVHLRGTPDIAQGELMRYLGEALWYPTALLPSQGVQWQALDATRARATLSDGATTVSLVFSFDAEGLVETVRAEARARTVGKRIEMTPWQVRMSGYAEHAGMLIPQQGEVAWLLPGGPAPYWRGTLESFSVEPAR